MILKISYVVTLVLLLALSGCGDSASKVDSNTTNSESSQSNQNSTDDSESSQSDQNSTSTEDTEDDTASNDETEDVGSSNDTVQTPDLKLLSMSTVDASGATIDSTTRYEGGSNLYLQIELANVGIQDLPLYEQYGYMVKITSNNGTSQIYQKIDAANMPIAAGSESGSFIIDTGFKIKNENNVAAELTINNYGDSINDNVEFEETDMENNTLSTSIPIYPVDLSIVESYGALKYVIGDGYMMLDTFSLSNTEYHEVGYVYTIKNNSEYNFYGDYSVTVSDSPFYYMNNNLISINSENQTIAPQNESQGSGMFFINEDLMSTGIQTYNMTLDMDHTTNDDNTENNMVSKSLEVTE